MEEAIVGGTCSEYLCMVSCATLLGSDIWISLPVPKENAEKHGYKNTANGFPGGFGWERRPKEQGSSKNKQGSTQQIGINKNNTRKKEHQ